MSESFVFLGDFSGLSLFLSRGLEKLGRPVRFYSNGDGWKGVPHGRPLYRLGGGTATRAFHQLVGGLRVGRELGPRDTLVISTEFLFNRWIDAALLGHLARRAGRTVLLHAGCSDGFHRLSQRSLLCTNCKQHDLHAETCVFASGRWPGLERFLRRLDAVVPFTDIYEDSARAYPVPASRVTPVLPFPVDAGYLRELAGTTARTGGTIHGLNRPGFKGTAYLRALMERRPALQQRVTLLPRLPFGQFVARVAGADVVLDQLFGNGYGMTGCIALAFGTAVAFGYTTPTPSPMFTGEGCIPFRIAGDPEADAASIDAALEGYLARPCPGERIASETGARHDNVQIASQFANLLA